MERDLDLAERKGHKIGVKLVRGAYMVNLMAPCFLARVSRVCVCLCALAIV